VQRLCAAQNVRLVNASVERTQQWITRDAPLIRSYAEGALVSLEAAATHTARLQQEVTTRVPSEDPNAMVLVGNANSMTQFQRTQMRDLHS
jgi:hypothetical protein